MLAAGDGALVRGGGSIDDDAGDGFGAKAGSGRPGISSSADDVSIVICLVVDGVVLRV